MSSGNFCPTYTRRLQQYACKRQERLGIRDTASFLLTGFLDKETQDASGQKNKLVRVWFATEALNIADQGAD
jgi:hypothetical protein